jgi:hypothetical protein
MTPSTRSTTTRPTPTRPTPTRSLLTFQNNTRSMPPGALVPGQRPDRALNNAQFAAATQARIDGRAQGLTGRAFDVFVAQAAMNAN